MYTATNMTGRWKERMRRMALANDEARLRELRGLTMTRAVKMLEGLLSDPLFPPRRTTAHPVSLSRRMGKRRV